jgi:hypothetical protein
MIQNVRCANQRRWRDAVVSANPELLERQLAKLAEFAAAMAGALNDRGIPKPTASLATEPGQVVDRHVHLDPVGVDQPLPAAFSRYASFLAVPLSVSTAAAGFVALARAPGRPVFGDCASRT